MSMISISEERYFELMGVTQPTATDLEKKNLQFRKIICSLLRLPESIPERELDILRLRVELASLQGDEKTLREILNGNKKGGSQ